MVRGGEFFVIGSAVRSPGAGVDVGVAAPDSRLRRIALRCWSGSSGRSGELVVDLFGGASLGLAWMPERRLRTFASSVSPDSGGTSGGSGTY